MTGGLPSLPAVAYELAAELQDLAVCPTLYLAAPDEADREGLLLRKLGRRGWERLRRFRDYGQGWGEKSLPAVSPRALDAFFQFLKDAVFPKGVLPSLFLTDEGGLELCWEDANGLAIQVAFGPTDVECYRASNQTSRTVPFSALPELVESLAH